LGGSSQRRAGVPKGSGKARLFTSLLNRHEAARFKPSAASHFLLSISSYCWVFLAELTPSLTGAVFAVVEPSVSAGAAAVITGAILSRVR